MFVCVRQCVNISNRFFFSSQSRNIIHMHLKEYVFDGGMRYSWLPSMGEFLQWHVTNWISFKFFVFSFSERERESKRWKDNAKEILLMKYQCFNWVRLSYMCTNMRIQKWIKKSHKWRRGKKWWEKKEEAH